MFECYAIIFVLSIIILILFPVARKFSKKSQTLQLKLNDLGIELKKQSVST